MMEQRAFASTSSTSEGISTPSVTLTRRGGNFAPARFWVSIETTSKLMGFICKSIAESLGSALRPRLSARDWKPTSPIAHL